MRGPAALSDEREAGEPARPVADRGDEADRVLRSASSRDEPSLRHQGTTTWALLGLVAALVLLRLYAALGTVTVRTWDDVQYRASAEAADAWIDREAGPRGLVWLALAPKPLLTEGARRSGGYLALLVVARQLLPWVDPERAYQMANVALLLVQMAFVYALFRAASRTAALAAVGLYVTMPFVFGVNRWVWTENHVMFALLAFTWAGVWLLGSKRRTRLREGVAGLAGGAVCALAAMTREYAAPSMALLPAVIVLVLLVRRRYLAAATFSVPVAIYAAPLVADIVAAAGIATEKASDPRYYHGVAELLLHSARHVTGLPGAVLLVAGLAIAARVAWRSRDLLGRREPLAPFLWAHLLLGVVYVALIVWSTNRISRGMVPIVWTALGALAVASRLAGPLEGLRLRRVVAVLAVSLVTSLGFLGYDLFIAFDGGRSYAAHAYQLGTFNHPLFLRPLDGPDDMHVVTP